MAALDAAPGRRHDDRCSRSVVVAAARRRPASTRSRDGLLDAKAQAALAEAARPASRTAQETLRRRPTAASRGGLRHPVRRPGRPRCRRAAAAGVQRRRAPAPGAGRRLRRRPRRASQPRSPTSASRRAARAGRDDRRRPALDLRRRCSCDRRAASRCPVVVVGAPVVDPERRAVRALLPLPARPGGRRRSTWSGARSLLAGARPGRCWSAAIAWLVTRQVVTPVRMAARIAERLAAGRLEERMQVRGEDDLARLGGVVQQDGARNLQRQIRQLEELSRVQRRFVSDVSHELRTPLTTVRMAADVLHEARADFDPAVARSRRAAADPARPVRVAARRPAGDQPVRRRARPRSRPSRPTCATSSARVVEAARAARRAARAASCASIGADAAVRRRGRRPPGRADPAQPGRQRRRARRGPAGRGAASPATTTRSRSPCATTASGCSPARRRWSSTASGGPTRRGPARPAAPASGCRSRSRTPSCTAAGCRRGASRATAAQFRLTLPRQPGDELDGSPIPLEPADSARPAQAGAGRRALPARPRTAGQVGGGVDV